MNKIKVVFTVLILFFCVSSRAQSNDSISKFFMFDEYPQFPGGQHVMDSFIYANFKMPLYTDIEKSPSGPLYIQFEVDTNGKMLDIKIIASRLNMDSAILAKEAIRVFKLMNNYYTWISGRHLEKKVPVMYRYPLKFQQGEIWRRRE